MPADFTTQGWAVILIERDNLETRLIREGLVSMAQAAKAIPSRGGGKAEATTVWRWAVHGRSAGKETVRLEAFRMPNGDWVTSLAALGRFFAAVNKARADAAKASPAAIAGEQQGDGQDAPAAQPEQSPQDQWADSFLDRRGVGTPSRATKQRGQSRKE